MAILTLLSEWAIKNGRNKWFSVISQGYGQELVTSQLLCPKELKQLDRYGIYIQMPMILSTLHVLGLYQDRPLALG